MALRRGSKQGTPTTVIGIWLSADPVSTAVEPLLLDMLEPNLPNPVLRGATVEELGRGVKLAGVVVESLGLRTIAVEEHGEIPLRVMAPELSRDPWREALVAPGGDRPIGLLIHTADAGPLVLVHDVFTRFGEPEKDLVRRYAALAARDASHERIVAALRAEPGFVEALNKACRTVQFLDPAVLFSPDGATRVQVGSLSQTTKDILREGLRGYQVFILPASLFERRPTPSGSGGSATSEASAPPTRWPTALARPSGSARSSTAGSSTGTRSSRSGSGRYGDCCRGCRAGPGSRRASNRACGA